MPGAGTHARRTRAALRCAVTIISSLLLAALVAAAPEPAAPVERKALRIAVYNLEGTGTDARVLKLVEQSLVAEVRKLQRASVISLDEVKAMLELETEKQLAGCSEGSCLAEIAEALGADALVTGGVVVVGEQVQVSWKRIEPSTASVTQTFTRTLDAAGGEELLAVVGPGVEALFPEVPLRAGQTRGVDPAIAVRLNPPPVAPWIFWTTVSSTAAVAIGTAGVGAVWALSEQALRQSFDNAKRTPVPASTIQQQQAQVQISNAVFWGAAGVVVAGAIVSGVLVPFTDFDNLRGAE
jgi:hypothetical protein